MTPGKADVWRYRSYEVDLVQGLGAIPQVCQISGDCHDVSPELQKMAQVAGGSREDTCYGNAYEIVLPVATLATGVRAYQVEMAPSLRGTLGQHLPVTALVPVFSGPHRSWTGFYFSRGC